MNVLLVAQDPGPTRALRKVAVTALRTHNVCTVFGDGREVEHDGYMPKRLAEWADVMVIGMSSFPDYSIRELDYCRVATSYGVPFGLFSDSFGVFKRAHFEEVRMVTSYLFVSSDAEVAEARSLFPFAHIVACGNPLWEDLVTFPYSRAEARNTLGLACDTTLVVCPGNKTLPDTQPNKNVQLVQAVRAVYGPSLPVHVAFLMHPGDRVDRSHYLAHLEGVAEVVGGREDNRKKQLVRACDLVVSACSPSTDLQALLIGTPVVNVLDDEIRTRLRREFDADVPPMVSYGYVQSSELGQASELRNAITRAVGRIAHGESDDNLPIITEVEAVRKILNTLCGTS